MRSLSRQSSSCGSGQCAAPRATQRRNGPTFKCLRALNGPIGDEGNPAQFQRDERVSYSRSESAGFKPGRYAFQKRTADKRKEWMPSHQCMHGDFELAGSINSQNSDTATVPWQCSCTLWLG